MTNRALGLANASMKTRNPIKDQIGHLALVLLACFGIWISEESPARVAVPSVSNTVEVKDEERLVEFRRRQIVVEEAVQIFNSHCVRHDDGRGRGTPAVERG